MKKKLFYQKVFFYLCLLLAIYLSSHFLGMILVGAFLAYLTESFSEKTFQTLNFSKRLRWMSAIAWVTLLFVILIVPLLLLVRTALAEVYFMLSRSSFEGGDFLQKIYVSLHHFFSKYNIDLSIEDISFRLTEGFRNLINFLLNSVSQVVFATPGMIIQVFFLIIAWIFFIASGPSLRQKALIYLIPFSEIRDLISRISQDVVKALVISTLALSLIHTSLYLLGFLIVGLPKLLLWVVVAFFCSWIPLIGTAPVALAAIGYLINENRQGAALFILFVSLAVGMSDSFIRPFFFSRNPSVKLGFFWTLIALIGGLQSLGLIGLIVGPLLFAVIYELIQKFDTDIAFQIQDSSSKTTQ